MYVYIFPPQYVWMFSQSLHIFLEPHRHTLLARSMLSFHTLGVHSLELLRKTSGAMTPCGPTVIGLV